jgi:hypothetical protein
MAKKGNTGDGGTSGFGTVDPKFQPPGPVYTDPGARNLNDPDWVQKDHLYKSSLPRTKYY